MVMQMDMQNEHPTERRADGRVTLAAALRVEQARNLSRFVEHIRYLAHIFHHIPVC